MPRPIPARSTTRSSPGTVGHIATELFAQTADIELTRIPYKGNGDAMVNLIGGHVSMMVPVIVPIIGKSRRHAAGARRDERRRARRCCPRCRRCRSRAARLLRRDPLWAGRAAGTPRPIIDRLNKELRAALAADDLRAKLAADGAVPEPGSPEDYATAIDVDEKKWAPIVKSLNLKFE